MARAADSPITEIFLDDLEEGLADPVLEVDASVVEFEDDYFSLIEPAQVRLNIGRSIETYTFSGSIGCIVSGECCRCLEMIEEPLETDFRLLVQRKQASEEELEAMAEEEEVMILDPGTKSLDLKEEIREALFLALPLRVYCKPDCKGLCAQCGANLNKSECDCTEKPDDSRWAALKELKFQ